MDTFLTFIGIIALLLMAKFIYDAYLTNNTEKVYNQYKVNNPEKAARIERNKGLDLSTKSKSRGKDKEDSILRMSRNMGCSPDELKEGFIKDLENQSLDQNKFLMMIQLLKEKKYEESRKFDIDPDDTSAAFMEKWTIEYFEKVKTSSITNDYEFKKEGISKDKAFVFNKDGEDRLSRGLYEEAIEFFSSAIQLQSVPLFFHNRADCYYRMGQPEKAKIDYLNAIDLDGNYSEWRLFSRLAIIFMGEKDYASALNFIDIAIEHSSNKVNLLYNRALIHMGLDDRKAAIKDLNDLISSEPSFVDAHILLGRLYLLEKNLEAASSCINTIKASQLFDLDFKVSPDQQIDIDSLEELFHLENLRNVMGDWKVNPGN